MAYSVSVTDMITRCQQRANRVGNEQIETPEWKQLITEYFGNLHSVSKEVGARYFETEVTLTLGNLALPADHLSTIGVDYVLDSAGRRRELAELQLGERTYFSGLTGEAFVWSLVGSNLVLYPSPSTGTYKHVYVPQPTDFSNVAGSTIVDFLNIHGYQYVLWGVASVAMHRGDSAQQRALGEADKALEKFTTAAIDRALTMPRRRVVTDVDFSRPYWWDQSGWRFQ